MVVVATRWLVQHGWVRQVRLGVPVISVGNLTWGGTGKTPCVELMARYLLERGCRPAILCRGYGYPPHERSIRRYLADGVMTADGARQPHERAGADEPALLASHLPEAIVMVGRNRCRTARLAVERWGADCVILDDGFQHWPVARDLDVVLVDATNPFGNGAVLPRGILREPVQALRSADCILFTKTESAGATLPALREQVAGLNPEIPVIEMVHEPIRLLDPRSGRTEPLAWLKERPVGVVSAIGDAAAFMRMLGALGARIRLHHQALDHTPIPAAAWRRLAEQGRAAGCEALVTTEKDWMRTPPAAALPLPVWTLQVALAPRKDGAFLYDRLARCVPAR